MDEAGEKIIRPTKLISKPSAAVKQLLEACPQVSSSVAQRPIEDEEVSAYRGAFMGQSPFPLKPASMQLYAWQT